MDECQSPTGRHYWLSFCSHSNKSKWRAYLLIAMYIPVKVTEWHTIFLKQRNTTTIKYVPVDSTDNHPKKRYSFINGKRCDSSGIPKLKKNGVSFSDPQTMSTILNDQFSSAITREDHSSLPFMPGNPSPNMYSFCIDNCGVTKLLNVYPKPLQRPGTWLYSTAFP